jgi:hypothetical protein
MDLLHFLSWLLKLSSDFECINDIWIHLLPRCNNYIFKTIVTEEMNIFFILNWDGTKEGTKGGLCQFLCNSTVIWSRDYRKLRIESVNFLSSGCKYMQ